jgi:hypothetical protein
MEGDLCSGDSHLWQAQEDAHLLNQLAREDGLTLENLGICSRG